MRRPRCLAVLGALASLVPAGEAQASTSRTGGGLKGPTARVVGVTIAFAFAAAVTSADAAERVITHHEAKSWSPAAGPARRFAEDRAGEVSFSVFDMRGRQRDFRGYSQAHMASTFKVMLLVAYLRQSSVAHRTLQDSDRSLLAPMIRRSDDDAASRIDAMLGRGPIEALAHDAGMRSFRWADTWGLSQTTPRDQAYFLRTLQHYIPDRHWDYARHLLSTVVPSQRWGIGQLRLHGWHLYFKGGWGSGTGWVDHQVVLLAKDGRRVGLAVMTENSPSHEYGKATLEGVFDRLLDDLPR